MCCGVVQGARMQAKLLEVVVPKLKKNHMSEANEKASAS